MILSISLMNALNQLKVEENSILKALFSQRLVLPSCHYHTMTNLTALHQNLLLVPHTASQDVRMSIVKASPTHSPQTVCGHTQLTLQPSPALNHRGGGSAPWSSPQSRAAGPAQPSLSTD